MNVLNSISINGVNTLDYAVVSQSTGWTPLFIILTIIIALIFSFLVLDTVTTAFASPFKKVWGKIILQTICSLILFIAGFFIITEVVLESSEDVPIWTVTFEDSASINEVIEDYQIIEQRGQVFYLIEKDVSIKNIGGEVQSYIGG